MVDQETAQGIPVQPDRIDEDLASLTGAERSARLVQHLATGTRGDRLSWISELATRSERHGLSLPEIRSIAADLAWLARDAGQRYPGSADWDAAATASRRHRLILAYVHGQRLRYDFKFEALQAQTYTWLTEFGDDALILALAAFAALGMRTARGLELYRQAIAAPDADGRTRHVCLHAIWFADHVPDQPQLVLDLSNSMMTTGTGDANLFYRRAYALRKLGRYDQALEEIDRAIGMLAPGNNAVHQDYVRERELITATRQMRQYADTLTRDLADQVTAQADRRITEASTKLAEKVESAQRVVSESTLKVVEILGLFVTLAGFLIGSGTVAFTASTFGQRITSMLIILSGSLIFFLLLRMVTGYRRRG
ncbi:hypothetical protein Lfu02_78000 [Longispora fulva]|uniref:Tetratricopeptide (TPR) repeat protein n=1 Tax=Longispora fulva TaxID=619741 RepID=A0A8J7GSJ0_9ACTN|nr:tetratricopeptide repeat protein [Longispora fulva]MBG6136246.1 tetratricopeptide (TPR) repeat protein [Longispora fulva]GIG63428.1 hypothetical protein Lfu02_78000 [Longispora fulva]